ncbi:MAG: hypothetical protein ACE5FA_10020, partial [Dehalococcoidia bacterium]
TDSVPSGCPTTIEPLYRPLCSRLGIIHIRGPAQWRDLQEAAPGIGPAPDFERGIAIAIASRAGQPLDGGWPISLQAVRVVGGAGFVSVHFASGTFLPDGTTYLEATFVEDLDTVLVVEVNGVRFYPQEQIDAAAVGHIFANTGTKPE